MTDFADRPRGGLSFGVWLLVLAWAGAPVAARAASSAGTACEALARTPWPLTSVGRADLLQRLELQREPCVEHAPFLALLGALWLEQGNPSQALIWLERALLLSPSSMGAQLDHALALAALGEADAARQLYARWQLRADIPPPVLHRLRAAVQGLDSPASGGVQAIESEREFRWAFSASVGGGHETNLDRSPTLSEIRLTPPEGPISLPLAVPLAPRHGEAVLSEWSAQASRSTAADVLWQAGALLNQRAVPRQSSANQKGMQLVLARWHQMGASNGAGDGWLPAWLHAPWRVQNQLSWGRASGPAVDTQQQWRYLLGAESDWRLGPGQCTRRFELELSHQRYATETLLSSVTPAAVLALDCRRVNGLAWSWGAHARWALDRPLSAERPGGRQAQASVGLRLGAQWRDSWSLDAHLRGARLADREGFSPLLDHGAARRQTQWLLSLDGAYRFRAQGQQLELWSQWQTLRQTSNIELFQYNATAAYAGLRWRL